MLKVVKASKHIQDAEAKSQKQSGHTQDTGQPASRGEAEERGESWRRKWPQPEEQLKGVSQEEVPSEL